MKFVKDLERKRKKPTANTFLAPALAANIERIPVPDPTKNKHATVGSKICYYRPSRLCL